MKKTIMGIGTFIVVALLAPMMVLASSGGAPSAQPLATADAAQRAAEDAQRAAENARNAAWSAQATAQAARGQATATAQVEATVQAEATRQAIEATATAQVATAQAKATRQAMEWQATQQALYLEGTREAQALSISATAEVAQLQIESTRQVAAARREQAAADREEIMKPIRTYGPWALFAIAIVSIIWVAILMAPTVERYLLQVGAVSTEPPQTTHPFSSLPSMEVWGGWDSVGEIIDVEKVGGDKK